MSGMPRGMLIIGAVAVIFAALMFAQSVPIEVTVGGIAPLVAAALIWIFG
jgi:hypothetical protein